MTSPSSEPTLRVERVSKRFSTTARSAMRYGVGEILGEFDVRRSLTRPELRPNEFWALDDVSLTVEPGQAVGVVGANGAGKTSLLRVVHGLSRPDAGEVVVNGRSGALIDLGASFVPFATGRESMDLEAALLGLDKADRAEVYQKIIEFADIGDFIDVQVSKYSLGMQMRLGYAIVAELEPALLLVDEVLSVGDIGFQRKCLNFINGYLERGGSVILVTHDLWAVRMVCSRCVVLDHGRIVADGEVDETITTYLTDYLAVGDHADPEMLADRSARGRAEGERPPEAGRSGGTTAGGGDAGEPEEDPGDAFRSGVVRVSSLEVTGPEGGAPAPLEPACVHLELECTADAPPFVCAFTITANGQMVPLTRAELPRRDAVTVRDGRTEVRAEIERLPLLGGSYLLRVLVMDADSGVLLAQKGWADEAVSFVVEEPERFVRTLFRIAGVMVKAEVDWSTTDVPAALTPTSAEPGQSGPAS